ncbi:hypothetical protein JMG10_22180 [Nostoc ellipsosporum NOK]|nr:hypothetical protein [Nostoc ellipsosporum NOK]
MPNRLFDTAISSSRFNKYLNACGNNKRKARKLYRANLALSEKLYSVIGIFEVILRNSIDRHFKNIYGEMWLEEAISPGGYLDISPGCDGSFHSIQEAIHKLGTHYTHDRLIAKLSFGFWVFQFASKDYAASGSNLLNIFHHRPHGLHQKVMFKKLVKIKELRNRIAHYEPICFDSKTGAISTAHATQCYTTILELLEWLGCNPAKILYGIDGVRNKLTALNAIHAHSTDPVRS